jgi:hypothetical protein
VVLKGWFCFKDIYTLAYHSNVPLQGFSGETTPIPEITSLIITEGLLLKREEWL